MPIEYTYHRYPTYHRCTCYGCTCHGLAGSAVQSVGRSVPAHAPRTPTVQNRLLRLVQRPAGVYHCSVFHQLSGGLGPSGIARDPQGNLYVTRYDFAPAEEGVTKPGTISKISPEGKLLEEIATPAPELTGICISPEQDALFVTEASTNVVYRIPL